MWVEIQRDLMLATVETESCPVLFVINMWLDGEYHDEFADEIAVHLRICDACCEYFEMSGLLRQWFTGRQSLC